MGPILTKNDTSADAQLQRQLAEHANDPSLCRTLKLSVVGKAEQERIRTNENAQTPFQRMTERLAGGSLSQGLRIAQQRVQERPGDQAALEALERAKLKQGALRARCAFRQEQGELSKGIRSMQFIQDVRKIQSGELNMTIWRALRLERKRRLRKLQMLAGGPVEDGDELVYPAGTWICGKCYTKNFPNNERCIGTDHGVRCEKPKTEMWGYHKAPVERSGYYGLPPSRRDRHCHRSYEARIRLRQQKNRNRDMRAEQSQADVGWWKCYRCEETNHLMREMCRKCSWVPQQGSWNHMEWEGDYEAAVAAGQSQPKRRCAKRGAGRKNRSKKKTRKLRQRAARTPCLPQGVRRRARQSKSRRKTTDGEKATDGRARAAGSGGMRHPIAHWRSVVRTIAAAGAAMTSYEVYQFLHVVRNEAERAVVATMDVVVHVGRTAEETVDIITVAAERIQMVIWAWTDMMIRAAPYFVCVFLGISGSWLGEWSRRVAGRYGYRGQRVGESKVPAPTAGSQTQEGLERCRTSAEHAEYLILRDKVRTLAREAGLFSWSHYVRNREGATQLYENGAVKHRHGHEFRVQSSTDVRNNYYVEIDVVGLQKIEGTCTCIDYYKRGEGCKHVGAVLLTMMGNQEQLAPVPVEDRREVSKLDQEAVRFLRAKALRIKESEENSRYDRRDGPRASGDVRVKESDESSRYTRRSGPRSSGSASDARLLELQDVAMPPPAERVGLPQVPAGIPEHMGYVRTLPGGKESHEVAIRLITSAEQYVRLLGFTYDRSDVTEALKLAKSRGVDVMVGIDRRWTLNGRTRDQLARLKELEAHGIGTRVVVGNSIAEEYRAVGKRGVGGSGILHAKAVHTDNGTLLGSTNWTTSSRANIELGAELALGDLEAAELKDWMSSVIEGGETINDAEVLVMQRSRSESPSRKR